MTVESATYLDDLNELYPEDNSPRNEIDDHIRLIKSVLKATFPGDGASDLMDAAITATRAQVDAWDARVTTLETTGLSQIPPYVGYENITWLGGADYTVSGVGFEPSAIIAAGVTVSGSGDDTKAQLCFSSYTGSDPNPKGIAVDHASYARTFDLVTQLMAFVDSGGTEHTEMTIKSLNSDGFILEFGAFAQEIHMVYMAFP